MLLTESVSEYGSGHQKSFPFFFFSFWIWLLITSSWDSISLPLPCFSCFLSSRVFLGPSVGGRLVLLSLHLMTLQLSGVLSLLSQAEALGLQQILCHFSGQMPSSLVSALCCFIWELSCDFRPLFSAFILSSLTWRSLLMELCFSRSVSFSQCLTESCDFMSSISSSEELTLGTYVHLHQLSLTAQLMTLFFWHIFSLSFSSHLVFSWYANEGPPFWSFLPCFPGVSSAGPWCCFSSVFFGCSNYVYLPLPQWNVCIVFITYPDMP